MPDLGQHQMSREKPRSPAAPAKMQEQPMVCSHFQAAVRSAPKTSKVFPQTTVDVLEEFFYDPWRLRESPGWWPGKPSSILGAQSGPQNRLLELWVAFRTCPDAVAAISKTFKNHSFHIVFKIMKLPLDSRGHVL